MHSLQQAPLLPMIPVVSEVIQALIPEANHKLRVTA